jgi:5-methylcytosine-specific restriction protein B
MTVNEILNRLTVNDIEMAMLSFETVKYERDGIKDKYILLHNGKEYPSRELIMRASNNELKRADNTTSYTTVIAKQKLVELGFSKFKDQEIMYRYYIKKVSKQDVEKTTVINSEAEHNFFGINLTERDDTVIIKVRYSPDGFIDKAVKLIKKQDIRIFIDRERIREGNLLLFENTDNGEFALSVKTSYDSEYKVLNSSLKNNYLLTNVLPLNESAANVVKDPSAEYVTNTMKQPLNQILFGPPGTGKTDATVEKALEILDLKTGDRTENREIFRSLLNRKIFFVTMHPSYSYEDFVQGIKPKTSDKGELLFAPKPGIFKIVSELATNIFEDEGEIIDNEVDNKDLLCIFYFLSKFNTKENKKASNYFGANTYSATYRIIGEKFSINPNTINNHVDKFDYLVSEERVGWKPRNGSDDKLDNSEMWPYNDVHIELKDKSFDQVKEVIKSIEKKSETKVKRTEKNTNYVLILDEINRANISKVFGELITLLEEDKRIGKENELSVTLTSGEIFSVPPNLYIIGTMNTADKSIALVDIALRRRFQFIPVYPDSSVIENHCKSSDKSEKAEFMGALNAKLRMDKGVDFQIGHAYFLKENSLADVINENIIPLLVEYLRNDLEKVKKLLSDIGKPLDEDYYNKTGLLKYIG